MFSTSFSLDRVGAGLAFSSCRASVWFGLYFLWLFSHLVPPPWGWMGSGLLGLRGSASPLSGSHRAPIRADPQSSVLRAWLALPTVSVGGSPGGGGQPWPAAEQVALQPLPHPQGTPVAGASRAPQCQGHRG